MRIEIQADAAPTLSAQQTICDEWVHEFNHVRPHEALGLRTPAEVYRPSDRKFGHIVLEGRPADCDLRPVFSGGWIKYRAQRVYVTDALRGFRVALREVGDDVHVHFFDLLLGRFRPGVDRSVHPFVPVRSEQVLPDGVGQTGDEDGPRQTGGLRPPEPSRASGWRGLSRRRTRPATAAAGASASTPSKTGEDDTRPNAEADSEAR